MTTTAVNPFTEPTCCGEPMVHNSATFEYECADAFFSLVDELDPEAGGLFDADRLSDSDVPADMVSTLQHWRASRRPDGWPDGCSPWPAKEVTPPTS